MKEIYLPLKKYKENDYTGKYEVSNLGNVRNIKTGQILKPRRDITNTGYIRMRVRLYDISGKGHSLVIARLVLTLFKPNNDNTLQVNHINEDSTDNRLENLEWCTPKENANHGTRTERSAKGHWRPVYCITNDTVYESIKDAGRKLNMDPSGIVKCCRGKKENWKGHKFEYWKGADFSV